MSSSFVTRLLPLTTHTRSETPRRQPKSLVVRLRSQLVALSLGAGKKSTSWKPSSSAAPAAPTGDGARKRAEEAPIQYSYSDPKKATAAIEHVVEDYDGMRFLLVANTNGEMIATALSTTMPMLMLSTRTQGCCGKSIH